MKVPNIFIPERNLDEQVENLKHTKKVKLGEIKELTDFVIREGLKVSKFGTYKEGLSFFLDEFVIDGIWVEYGLSIVKILKFRDAHTLKLNMNYILENRREWTTIWPFYAIIKDVYAGIIYAHEKNEAKEIVDNYVEKFGFEVREIISARK